MNDHQEIAELVEWMEERGWVVEQYYADTGTEMGVTDLELFAYKPQREVE